MMVYMERLQYFQADILTSLAETGMMVGLSVIAAVLAGLPLGTVIFLSRPAGVYQNRYLYRVTNAYVNIVRSFPFLLLIITLIPFVRWLIGRSFGTLAASLPLSIVAVALFARSVEQVFLDVPQEVLDLARTLGASKWQLAIRFLLVEACPGLILSLTSVTISMISYSTIVGVVGGGGIGDFAIRYGYQRYETDMMYTTIVIMIIGVMLLHVSGTTLAQALDKRK